jgi:radical SAM protein with 4Fe4S-binding SPASM domain
LSITGGEPTLHPEFPETVKLINSFQIPFVIFTNARWRYPTDTINLLKSLRQFKGLLVSLHGANAASHESFTNVLGSWEETVTNIRLAVEAGIPVTTSTVLTRQNWMEISAIIEFSAGLGANHAVFNRYIGKPVDDIALSAPELAQAMETIETLRHRGAKVKFGNCTPRCFYPSSSTGCLSGVTYCTIDPWGNVRPCNHAPLICGNLLEQPIEEIWHSETMETWRYMVPEQCHECLEFSKCHGGCRALAMLIGSEKDPLVGNPVLTKPQEAPAELVLYEGVRPLGRFAMRSEPFGYVLIQGNRVAPVSHEAKAVLDVLDGQTTLAQIQDDFGDDGLSFVGSLIRQGFIVLQV